MSTVVMVGVIVACVVICLVTELGEPRGQEDKDMKEKPKKEPPSITTMERWVDNGVARATDGCKVEPDGICPHGKPSWLLELGYI